jgi:hypothetical protein
MGPLGEAMTNLRRSVADKFGRYDGRPKAQTGQPQHVQKNHFIF